MTRSAPADAIPSSVHEFLVLDAGPLVAVTLAAAALALVGSFLVLRRQAMLGDAMAHAVLPGLVAAFWLTGSRHPGPMFAGALAAAILTSAVIGAMTKIGRVEPTTAIGVAFTTMFALGVLLVEVTGARNVDLDLDCVLSGQLELLFWQAPRTWSELWSLESALSLPRPVRTLAVLLGLTCVALASTWKIVRCATFDEQFAATKGLRVTVIQGCMLALTTGIVVASFEALGSILVIALLTCPAASARLLTRSLGTFVVLATLIGAACGISGYLIATRAAPIGLGHSVDASGTVAALAGVTLMVVAIASTRVKRGSREPHAAAAHAAIR